RDRVEHPAETIDIGAREVDAVELPFESGGFARRFDRHEWSADRCGGRRLAGIETQIGEYAADAASLGIKGFFHRVEARSLTGFDAIERGLQARKYAFDADARGFKRGPR